MLYGDLPTGNRSMTCPNPDCLMFLDLFSANRGDYFWANPADEVECAECGESMRIAREVRLVELGL